MCNTFSRVWIDWVWLPILLVDKTNKNVSLWGVSIYVWACSLFTVPPRAYLLSKAWWHSSQDLTTSLRSVRSTWHPKQNIPNNGLIDDREPTHMMLTGAEKTFSALPRRGEGQPGDGPEPMPSTASKPSAQPQATESRATCPWSFGLTVAPDERGGYDAASVFLCSTLLLSCTSQALLCRQRQLSIIWRFF